ncbi:MAG TPA: preprotein translocase [Nitrosomonas nitrosa]|nr:preprotein translocase [Nitrosomonas nitrosa]HNP52723.1 integrase family protein [Nitrosomonas nitrosa]
MNKISFTASVIEKAQCEPGKKQTIFYDSKTPGLGLRVTAGAKSYIFESRLHGNTIRITIGSSRAWPLKKAQTEAARLKVMIDQGIDPRQLKAEQAAAKEAEDAARKAQEAREIVTVRMAWNDYVASMKPHWGAHHLHDHVRAMQAGGEPRARSKKLTEPGTLAALAEIRLIDLTVKRMTAWAKEEGAKRPARARNARTLLNTFLNWCIAHPVYSEIVTSNPAQGKDVKRHLGKPAVKSDALQREQLSAWFNAVRQIGNPVISAYLQIMLLIGARPNELISVRWEDIDFQWKSLTIRDKWDKFRVIPLTPYVDHLMTNLPRRNDWVFSSPTSASGHLVEPRIAHDKACAVAGLDVTLHGLRRSFASLCEWIEMPAGIAAQIQGHKPQGVREKHYIRRPLDLLRMWHVKIEAWILQEAGISFVPEQTGLHVIKK